MGEKIKSCRGKIVRKNEQLVEFRRQEPICHLCSMSLCLNCFYFSPAQWLPIILSL